MPENASDRFRVERDGAVARITLCRAGEGNTLAPGDMRALGAAVRDAGSAPLVKVVLIAGEGADFCLGRRAAAAAPPLEARAFRQKIADAILGVYEHIRATPVPVMAAVQGRAKGFGCALAAQCDITIAEADAAFSLPEMEGNLPPTLAISACMRKMPAKAVLHMVLTREPVNAETAFHHGLISEIAPKGRLAERADATLAKLADRDRDALIAIKEYCELAAHMDPAGAARYAANLLAAEMTSARKA